MNNLLVFPFVLMILLMVLLTPVLVGSFVFQDARKRGMEPIPWTIVAVFVPMFIGLIIYFFARSNQSAPVCSSCGQRVQSHFKTCPYCGYVLYSDMKGV